MTMLDTTVMKWVLVVDDKDDCRNILSIVLRDMGYNVIGASCGNDALNEMAKRSFDIVFTDLNMKGMDGWTLAIEIRKINRISKIVMTTAEDKDIVMGNINNSLIDEVILKPFSLDDIYSIIKKLC